MPCSEPYEVVPQKAEPITGNITIPTNGAMAVCFYNDDAGARVFVNGHPIEPQGDYCFPVFDSCAQYLQPIEIRWESAVTGNGALYVSRYFREPLKACNR